MAIPKELAELMQTTHRAAQAGNRKSALDSLEAFSFLLAIQDSSTDFEFVSMLAVVGKLYESMNEREMATLNLADTCAFAERHFPKTAETSGDYFDLSSALERMGDIAGAIKALTRAEYHLVDDPTWPQYKKGIEARKMALESKLGSA
ncbi:MAG: hypothetical protein WA765_03325 [Candidatus Acidiferrum sp.]